MNMIKFEIIEEFEVLVEKNELYVFFKYSMICLISYGVYIEF